MTEAVDEKPPGPPPRVLLLYYSYTGQSQKVLEAAGEVFRERGYDVTTAPIEFTDPRYSERFSGSRCARSGRSSWGCCLPRRCSAPGTSAPPTRCAPAITT